MFVSKAVYQDLKDSLTKAQLESRALAGVNAQLNAHIEWMRVRLTQLEFERAQLLKRFMNIDVPTPTFEQPDNAPDPNQTISFNDIGDTLAKELGIGWNDDGTLRYNADKDKK